MGSLYLHSLFTCVGYCGAYPPARFNFSARFNSYPNAYNRINPSLSTRKRSSLKLLQDVDTHERSYYFGSPTKYVPLEKKER